MSSRTFRTRGQASSATRRSRGWSGTVVIAVIAVIAAVAALSACSGVPTSSRPEVVRTVTGSSPGPNTVPGPAAGSEPRDIVFGFLRASLSPDARHSGARQFLTPDAGTRWQDGTVQIVNDYNVSVPTTAGDTATVKVSGEDEGKVNEAGEFSTATTVNGAPRVLSDTFQLRKVNGEWRIDKLPQGVLISESDFTTYYTARPLYFYDLGERQLVPDLRYSPLSDQALASWLMTQILAGPRPELAQSVQTEIPDQTDPRRVNVTMGNVISVEIPGSSQLDGGTRIRLATELAYTFSPVRFTARLTLTDSGKPVEIPTVGTVFSNRDFPSQGIDRVASANPYYLRNGGLINGGTGRPIPGAIGSGAYDLTTVAVQQITGDQVRVAGLNSNGLAVGASGGALVHIKLPKGTTGAISRPEWEPGQQNVWVGVGGELYRVLPNHQMQQISVPLSNALPKGQIEAIRFSPDGVRLAVVLQTAENSTLWIGSVARNGSTESVQNFVSITPASLKVSDVAWEDPTSLILLGATGNSDRQIWTVQSDGSFLASVKQNGLPRNLENVAAAAGSNAMVWTSEPSSVWIQNNGAWSALIPPEATLGSAPAYATQ
jgi:Lipoprotein LpqB beta-propeller domain